MLPNAQPKPRPRILDKRIERLERERTQREVYAAVAARDGRQCRCCGRQGQYGVGGEKTLHRHHLVYRSAGGLDVLENLLTLCAVCHALEHAKQLWAIGWNANQIVKFEIHEAAVVDAFGTRVLPKHVSIVTGPRR